MTCPTLKNMGFWQQIFIPKDGFKIRVIDVAMCLSLFCDDFTLNGVWRRGSPFRRDATDKNASQNALQTAICGASTVNSDGPGGRAMTRILSPIFLWSFSHQICMFLTMGQKSVTIFYIFQPGLLYIHIYELTMQQKTSNELMIASRNCLKYNFCYNPNLPEAGYQ